MKRITILLTVLAMITSGCSQATKNKSDNRFLITPQGVDIFLVGQKVPTQTGEYSISKTTETREEEGEEYEVVVYTVSENEQDLLKLETPSEQDNENEQHINDIFILSEKYKTAENIGLHSTIEEFAAVYPNFTVWWTYVSDRYVIEAGKPSLENVQFILDKNGFRNENGPDFDNDYTVLKISDFKKDTQIKEIRIFGVYELE
jgi:hypothetical protein